MEHESLHIAISQQGETTSDLRLRKGSGSLTIHPDLVAMAGVASEEYRVERVLCEQHPERREGQEDDFETAARRIYAEARSACRIYQEDRDLRKVFQAVLGSFHALATWTAYLAGALTAAGKTPSDLAWPDPLDELVLDETWDEFVLGLQSFPDARIVTSREDLDARAFDLAVLLDDWLESVGFTETLENGKTVFKLLRPEDWMIDIDGM